MDNKTVCVLLATHNSSRYLSAQLESILNQTYNNISITVSDDSSSDGTQEIIKDFLKYENIKQLSSQAPLKSAQANFMFLLKNAPKADYYMFADHDDVWLENKIEHTLNTMLKTEMPGKPALVHSDLTVVDENLNIISDSMFSMQKLEKFQRLESTLIQNNVTGCTVMINGCLRELALKKTDTGDMLMHDWFLAILASATGTVGFVDAPLIFYRQHGDNEVGAKDAGSIGYIAEKASRGKKNRESLEKTFLQAKMIAELYGEALGDSFTVIEEYGKNIERGKLKRLKSCIKYGFWKNTLLRRLGQIIYI